MKISINKHELQAKLAAQSVEKQITKAINIKGVANIILATGSSQLLFLKELRQRTISWENVIIFHLDEYIGLEENHPASFRNYLKENIIQYLTPKQFYPIDGDLKRLEEMMDNYTLLIEKHPIDVACIGIGENGHLAFNDPGVADFRDSKLIKVVTLDKECRRQQFNEGWFESIDAVPKTAITLTIPTIMNSHHISCFVPEERKAHAVKNALEGTIDESCPASILRKHGSVELYLDPQSAKLIEHK